MAKVKFYLDKADKSSHHPIYLVLRTKGVQIKIYVGEKVKQTDWDVKKQILIETSENAKSINNYISFLRTEIEAYLNSTTPANLTSESIKIYISAIIESRKENKETLILCEEKVEYRAIKKIKFIDLFAGAGGFSEGFLQAEINNTQFDFVLASDINENCELTHIVRYNYQLNLKTEFFRKDITDETYLEELIEKLKGQTIDVICGGPPCQSFSLAGKRKKFDKKDDLFSHYLKVIKQLRPKYFVMENVKGILTKESGKIKDMILAEIKSIVDPKELHLIITFLDGIKREFKGNNFLFDCYKNRIQIEGFEENEKQEYRNIYINFIEKRFKELTPKAFDYKTSKTNYQLNTIRHGFNLLKREKELDKLKRIIINEKTQCNLSGDDFIDEFDSFIEKIEISDIIEKIDKAVQNVTNDSNLRLEFKEIIQGLELLDKTFDEIVSEIANRLSNKDDQIKLNNILKKIRLYNIDLPFVALASNYGVPQNRERVLFIGCRKDQKVINDIPATIPKDQKVTVFEALHDLDFLENNDERFNYDNVNYNSKLNGSTTKLLSLLKPRTIDGKVDLNGLTYSEWSKNGRLIKNIKILKNPFYVRSNEELLHPLLHISAPLHNHKTSNQNPDVVKRLNLILNEGDYKKAKKELISSGVESEKRNYNVLNPEGQSPTVMTIPDDYIHYANPRALTVREMARLQSFDDSFVFQGKRSTGGEKRKSEIPQFTLVGNAVPPLLARAIGMEILKNIE